MPASPKILPHPDPDALRLQVREGRHLVATSPDGHTYIANLEAEAARHRQWFQELLGPGIWAHFCAGGYSRAIDAALSAVHHHLQNNRHRFAWLHGTVHGYGCEHCELHGQDPSADLLDYSCPDCPAGPGERCEGRDGFLRPLVHRSRLLIQEEGGSPDVDLFGDPVE